MKRALEAKFAPGSQLAGKLLETGTKRLVEHTTVSSARCKQAAGCLAGSWAARQLDAGGWGV